MRKISTSRKSLGSFAAACAGALVLGACQAEEAAYEADVEDTSGGEMVVVPENAEGVALELPETPMTPEPIDDAVMDDDVPVE